MSQEDFFEELSEKLGLKNQLGHEPIRFLELHGASIIEPTAFEPDPATHRGNYYYNAITNTLYKKIVTRKEPGIVVAHWKKVSE